MATNWTTVRLPTTLYKLLSDRRAETNTPIATMVRVAVERYLETDAGDSFLALLKENQDFLDEVREIILNNSK